MRFTASDNKLFDSKHLQKLFKEEKKLELSRELFVKHVSSVLSPRLIQKVQKAANLA
jgi:hypothetical protein